MAKPQTTVVLTPQMPMPRVNTKNTAIKNAVVSARLTAKPIHHARHVHEPRSKSGAAISALTVSKSRASGNVQRVAAAGVSSRMTIAAVMTAPC